MTQRPLARPGTILWSVLPLLALSTPIAGRAQGDFDLDRAFILDSTVYQPFYVTETLPLRQALDEGLINEKAPLLVMEHPVGTLAFSVDQMAYHHLAQGVIDGEPWMVSF